MDTNTHEYLLFTLIGKEANGAYEFTDAIQSPSELTIKRTRSPGILLAKIDASIDVETRLREELWRFYNLKKVAKVGFSIPLNSDVGSWNSLSEQLSRVIGDAPYRMTLHRVSNEEKRKRIIESVTSKIKARVDLDHFSVEIIGYLIDSTVYIVDLGKGEISLDKLRFNPPS